MRCSGERTTLTTAALGHASTAAVHPPATTSVLLRAAAAAFSWSHEASRGVGAADVQ
jgi:hypothetical protein